MTSGTRLRISASAAVPTLVAAVVVLPALAFAGLISWTVTPAVVLALAAQSLVTFIRLGRVAQAPANREPDAET